MYLSNDWWNPQGLLLLIYSMHIMQLFSCNRQAKVEYHPQWMVRNGSDESYECSVRKIAFAAVVYELWHYRNLKVFLNILFPPAITTERIMADIGVDGRFQRLILMTALCSALGVSESMFVNG